MTYTRLRADSIDGSIPDLAQCIDYAQNTRPPDSWPTFDGQNLDRSKFMTASEVGKCLRSVYYDKTVGAPSFATGWGMMQRGHAVEAWVAARLKELKLTTTFARVGDDQLSYHLRGLSGTPDGIIFNEADEAFVLDIKSIDPRTNKKYLPKAPHYSQVQQNIHLVREIEDGVHVVGGILFYINASDFEDSVQFSFPPDDAEIKKCINRGAQLHAATKAEDLPAEGMLVKDGCKWCRHTNLCSGMVQQQRAVDDQLAEAERAMANVFR
jgi:hypothetical protein